MESLSTLVARGRAELTRPRWRHHVPLGLTTLVVLGWLRAFIPLVIRQQRNHATFDYDLGIFDQIAWLLAHGESFITLRGLPFLGHHLNLGMALFAPAYRLGAGPELLNAVAVLALAACVVPIGLIWHRYRPATSWYVPAFAFAFLFNPIIQALVLDGFYPEYVAMPFMLGAIWAAIDRRWRLFVVCAVFTVIWKEDLALFLLALGIAVAVKRDRRIGLWTAGAALAYFVLATRVVIPHFAGGGAFYSGFLGQLGDSPWAVVHNLVTEPSLFTDKYNENDGTGYLVGLSRPWLFTPLLSPSSLLLALPTYLVNILSSQGYTQDLARHYVAVPFVATVLSAIRGTAARSTALIRGGLAVGIVAMTLWTHNAGTGPWSNRYETGIWAGLVRHPHDDVLDRATRLVPEDAVVAASFREAPQLSRREGIFSFPNPWIPYNWGIEDRDPPSPQVIDWIVVDRQLPSPSAELRPRITALLDRILASGCFVTDMDNADVVVAHRVSRDCPL